MQILNTLEPSAMSLKAKPLVRKMMHRSSLKSFLACLIRLLSRRANDEGGREGQNGAWSMA
jgi:hypothetical protein